MSQDPRFAVERLQNLIAPLLQGQYSSEMRKVSIYVESVSKSLDSARAALEALKEKRATNPDMGRDDYGKREDMIRETYQRSLKNFLDFARRNLDLVLMQALEDVAHKPRLASKADLEKKATALQKSFDRMDDPAQAMLEHYMSTSDPLNKYLVAGPWGHQYLLKRKIDLEEYDSGLCKLTDSHNTEAGRVVISYSPIRRAIDELEAGALDAVD